MSHCDGDGLIEPGCHRGDVRAPDRADQDQRSRFATVEEQQVRQCGVDEGQHDGARVLVDRDTTAVGEIEGGNGRNAKSPSCKGVTELMDERLHHVRQCVEERRVQRPECERRSDQHGEDRLLVETFRVKCVEMTGFKHGLVTREAQRLRPKPAEAGSLRAGPELCKDDPACGAVGAAALALEPAFRALHGRDIG